MDKINGMIDVGEKDKTQRTARAQGKVVLTQDITQKIKSASLPKGNVLEAAKIAAIMAAKNTAGIIPLCHNIELNCVHVSFEFDQNVLVIESRVKSFSRTGVEMEAMVAVSAAALTVYDMCKMFTKSIEIKDVYLLEKTGGKSGRYSRK